MELAKITLEKKDLKSLYWLLFSEDSTFESFINVCNSWAEGQLPDEKGQLGNKKNISVITVHWFRYFEGEILEKDIAKVLLDISNKKVLLKKSKESPSKLPSMEDVSRDIKTAVKLKDCIREYYMEKYSSIFPLGCKWEDMIVKLPSLSAKKEFEKLQRAAGDNFLSSLLKRNILKEDRVFPPSLAIRLEEIYNAQFGVSKRMRTKPYLTFLTTNLGLTISPKFEEPLPKCPIAIVDFSRDHVKEWTDTELYVLF